MKRVTKWVAKIGTFAIAAVIVAVLFAMTDKSISNAAARDSFITAFGGAAFAYFFVKYGELFSRFSRREKLNADTIVSLQYALNKHLNFIGDNLSALDEMIKVLKKRDKKRVPFLQFREIPVPPINLQDLKNIDFITDVFNYFTDIEKINTDLTMLQRFFETVMSDLFSGSTQMTMMDTALARSRYQTNSTELMSELEEIRKFIVAADKKVVELQGKTQYVLRHRAWWLEVSLPWFSITHYDDEKLKRELPGYIAKFKKGQQENIAASTAEIAEIIDLKKKIQRTKADKNDYEQ